MEFIGLTGLARSGKDTAADILCKHLGWTRYALASPIKDAIDSLFGYDERHRDGALKEEELYTKVFTREERLHCVESIIMRIPEVRAAYDAGIYDSNNKAVYSFDVVFRDHVHYHQFENRMLKISPRKAYQLFGTEWGRQLKDSIWIDIAPKTNVVWTDVRFDNEAEAIKAAGGKLIKVVNPNQSTIDENQHASEAGVSESLIDCVVENPMKIEPFRELLLASIERLLIEDTNAKL